MAKDEQTMWQKIVKHYCETKAISPQQPVTFSDLAAMDALYDEDGEPYKG
ncbi:MAG: hypothetical protein J3T61_12545 [Candidatus Brocadiales bacterium]|nr:hypothetical protein [Candidatus Bathyanammoxibius sp.]